MRYERTNKVDYIDVLRDRVQLKEGDDLLEKFLSAVYFRGPVPTKELARHLALPVPVAAAIKKEWIKLGLMKQENGVQMTKSGSDYFENGLGYAGIDRSVYPEILTNQGMREALIQELSEKYAALFDERPSVDVTIDQAKCTAETAFRRAMLCLEHCALVGKRVLCVGDDDLVSVAAALLLKRLFRTEQAEAARRTYIGVFDVDDRYIAYITRLAAAHDLPIECVKADLRDPLPLSLSNSFDCFFTDPPYTIQGLSLFLSRGVGALKNRKGLKVFLSFGQKPVDENFSVQECILSQGLSIVSLYKNFNRYEGASLLGNVSQMLVLESTSEIRPVISFAAEYAESIYTREFKKPDSQYVCRNCKTVWSPGGDGLATIEQLKSGGCPSCGGTVFDLMQKKAAPAPAARRKSLGQHILADFYECGELILGDLRTIQRIMHAAAERAGATIVSEDFHRFSPWGISGAVIIQESHLTIHTWPEYRYAAIDLFTCGDSLKIWQAFEYLKESFKCGKVEYNNISRGRLKPGESPPVR